MAAHRPGPGFQAACVVGEDQLLEREGEGVAGREPARALRPGLRDQLRTYIKECVAGAAADPLEAAADEGVAVQRLDVDGHAAAGLVAVDQAESAGGVGRVGDRPHVLQVPRRVEEVGRRHQRGPGVDPLGEGVGRNRHAVPGGDELHFKARSGQPLVADGREVELADQDLVPPWRQGEAAGQRRQGDRDRRGDRGRAGRCVQELADLAAEPLEKGKPFREPDRRALPVPVVGVPV